MQADSAYRIKYATNLADLGSTQLYLQQLRIVLVSPSICHLAPNAFYTTTNKLLLILMISHYISYTCAGTVSNAIMLYNEWWLMVLPNSDFWKYWFR